MSLPEGLSIKGLPEIPNIAEHLSDQELLEIGQKVKQGYEDDEQSRSGWMDKYSKGLELALQVVGVKNEPWPNASNIKFPALQLAALQFHARAYPFLVPVEGPVASRVLGFDIDGTKAQRAYRVQSHMNYQIMEQMDDWESDMDRLLLTLPITGSEFKKTYYNSELDRKVSEHVYAKDFVVDYYSKSLDKAYRKTQILELTRNEIHENVVGGLFLDVDLDSPPETDIVQSTINDALGTEPPPTSDTDPYKILEQHTYLDLDDDGYEEPYIVTIDKNTGRVLRIAARFISKNVVMKNKEIHYIIPDEYFTQYTFIPSPDGGIYGLGFMHLIGPMNEAINTILNQLVDAGTLSNLQSGFISRHFRQKAGSLKFAPGEWKPINATGLDIKQGLFPLPVREPSMVLFQLLGVLIEVTQKVTSTTDMMVGENPGQNQKATTTMAVLDNGMKVFTAVYKRVRNSLKTELRKLYKLNGRFPNNTQYMVLLDPANVLDFSMESDYAEDDLNIIPSSDPNAAGTVQKVTKASALLQLIPYGLPRSIVLRRYLEALEIENIDEFKLDQLDQQPQVDPELLIAERKLQLEEQDQQFDQALGVREQERKERETDIRARQTQHKADSDSTKNRNQLITASMMAGAKETSDRMKTNAKPTRDKS